jgi:hypothetical protein
LGGLDTAALSLMEAEQDEPASHTVKLGQSIKSFNLLTPDYTKEHCCQGGNYVETKIFFQKSFRHGMEELMRGEVQREQLARAQSMSK